MHKAERRGVQREAVERDGQRRPRRAPAVERVVRREDRYWVVEKIGVAGEVSEDLDPRAQ